MTETERNDARRKEEFAARLKAQPVGDKAQGKVNSLSMHTIQSDETLSGIAQKYYGHATREYWMVIYEANKAVIGDNPGLIKPGVELTIPELPPALQDK